MITNASPARRAIAKDKARRVDPLDPTRMTSLKHWGEPPERLGSDMRPRATVDCGWGRVIFGHTFASPAEIAEALRDEAPERRDIALYVRDPHVVVAMAPQHLFIDPSHTYRLDLGSLDWRTTGTDLWRVRPVEGKDDSAIDRIYRSRRMVPATGFYGDPSRFGKGVEVLVAEDGAVGTILGAVTGIDHVRAFGDVDLGSSLWSLAVDPQCPHPGVGEGLVRALASGFAVRNRAFMDLSVMYDKTDAIGLYEKLGFVRVPVYCVKNKNPINEWLFIGPDPAGELNVYARILVEEARRRGIGVELLDSDAGYFRLAFGGRQITCRESLTELTTAVAMSRCDDKRITHRVLAAAGLRVPEQIEPRDPIETEAFIARHQRVVVKPARGEQGYGVRVDLRSPMTVHAAVAALRDGGDAPMIEEMVAGEDVRIIVIDYQYVAAATRRPAEVVGDGQHTLAELIEKQSRRRQAATGGESRIPLDAETRACIEAQGVTLDDVLPEGRSMLVRKTANLHTGGTIHDITERIHPELREVAVRAARALDIPVVGFDFMVPDLDGTDYVIIEANERPGLANHEPQPTAQRFIDLLFPQTKT